MDITGRVTADALVRTLSDNRKVVNFTVAVNDSYKAKSGERVTQTEFFDCSYWIASGIAGYLTKGSIVELTGRVSARAWIDGEGNAKAGLNFHTSKINLLGGGSATDAGKSCKVAEGVAANTEAVLVNEPEVVGDGKVPNDDLPF